MSDEGRMPEVDGASRTTSDSADPPKRRRRHRQSAAQTMGGILFGFEQQVWRTAPPPQELVHHARPDAPVPAGDGSMITIELPSELVDADAQEERR